MVAAPNVEVVTERIPLSSLNKMTYGNKPVDGGNLFLSLGALPDNFPIEGRALIRPIAGSHDFINGHHRHCIWISNDALSYAETIPFIAERINKNRENRLSSPDIGAQKLAQRAHQFRDIEQCRNWSFIVPRHSSENRPYLPIGILDKRYIINDSAFALYDAPLWSLGIVASKIHLIWIATVCGKIKTDFRYSNTLGWNTFPLPPLTEKNKADLTRCAEDILLAREAHFPATIAELYDPENMPENLRHAHERNDEVLERIYIGRRFKNDTERLEKLFDLYTKMTAEQKKPPVKRSAKK